MADFAATAGKTDDMTHANAKIVPPARHENRMAARAYALVMRWLVRLAALITVAILVFLIGYILVNGIPNLKPSLFEWTYNSDNVSLMPALINTILMTAFSLAIATPLGIFAAVWLVEYAKRGSKLVKVVRITTETLQGIPSIVYGLFGMLFFVMQLKWGYSLIAGAFTLAIMVLPVIMRTTEEALLAVPDSYREDERRDLFFGDGNIHAHHRGSATCSAGFLPRGQLWPGGRQAAHRIHHCAAQRHAGHPVRRDFGNGPHCRRNRGPDLHGQHRCRRARQRVQLRPYPCHPYVSAFQRGPAYQ